MRTWLFAVLGVLLSTLVVGVFIYQQKTPVPVPQVEVAATPNPSLSPDLSPTPAPSESPVPIPSPSGSPQAPDLSVDANGLSKATVVISTSQGIIKFKFYPLDAPKTVKRLIELIQQGFYNGLTFHRVKANFIIQGGDPTGTGTGGSGQKLDAEFNSRRHIEGTVAMARNPSEQNSADSQFYITLSAQPKLDKEYTVVGQVVEGMDIVKKIQQGDKMIRVEIQ